ncbi:hypothetical protein COU78_02395 [Candidatus Peregrinibacteria bacterium CG10_big_fil_rev_8_21_14_0_10_49_24]|nr:MAG: hypothetical protein COV83_02375 [Candidatus Peregrinibacteria bacterium CG11_big_fil_rev_8_21_14_0_20_49_14]PIR50987.1 MAG: hypothetical protein COU78_02395 [Candidatus Peregrinibacteria bacterium CG10_big_fil_rev_8_21_14_0_10_49_24]PJA67540.1 MAG: hypothetical protein CO157_03875 [Candidatus Peregrinibacteria bacterium CG_4_9_14_3_um_filter_49_12]
MKKYVVSIALVLTLAGCSSLTGNVQSPDGTGEEAPLTNPPAVLMTIDVLANALGLMRENIILLSYEERQWPDSCLGIQLEGAYCAQVVTPGYRAVLKTDTGFTYVFRTNMAGDIMYTEPDVAQ